MTSTQRLTDLALAASSDDLSRWERLTRAAALLSSLESDRLALLDDLALADYERRHSLDPGGLGLDDLQPKAPPT